MTNELAAPLLSRRRRADPRGDPRADPRPALRRRGPERAAAGDRSLFMSFNSIFQPQPCCLQDGRRSETVKEDATLSTTTVEALHGHAPSFRYNVFYFILTDTDKRAKVCKLVLN